MLALLVSTILSEGVIGSELWIHNADEFVEFSNLTDKKNYKESPYSSTLTLTSAGGQSSP